MDRELIFKKIDNCFEIRKNLWTTLIVLNGGIAGLILSMSSLLLNTFGLIKIALLIIGIIIDYFLFQATSWNNEKLLTLLNKIETGEQL